MLNLALKNKKIRKRLAVYNFFATFAKSNDKELFTNNETVRITEETEICGMRPVSTWFKARQMGKPKDRCFRVCAKALQGSA